MCWKRVLGNGFIFLFKPKRTMSDLTIECKICGSRIEHHIGDHINYFCQKCIGGLKYILQNPQLAYVPFQTCPKCMGNRTYPGMNGKWYPCDVCEKKGVIPMHVVKQ